MGFLDLLFTIIVLCTVGSLGVAYLAGRAVWRGGRRLLGWMNERKLLTGDDPTKTQEARDVVIEPVDDDEDDRPARPSSQAYAAEPREPLDYVRLNVDAGTTPDQIIEVMRGYVSDPVVGERAELVIQTLRSRERRRQSLSAELDGTFQRGSLSWDKFAGPINAALDALLRNSALLGNRIQAFDSDGYIRLFKSVQRDASGATRSGAQGRAERLKIYQDMLASLDALQDTNESLLTELDKLAAELGTLQRADDSAAESATLAEIRRLVEEARFYRDN